MFSPETWDILIRLADETIFIHSCLTQTDLFVIVLLKCENFAKKLLLCNLETLILYVIL